MLFDNRSLKASRARRAGLHFAFRANGKRIVYCYIRKNACSSFKRMIVSGSPHKEKKVAATSLQFLQRFHAERGGDVGGYDHAIFVIRDPAERLVSVFKNKFVQRAGNRDIFANYAEVTGRDPQTASFEEFMTHYIGRPFARLDLHVRPQTENLLPAVYSDALLLDDLRAGMTGIIGPRLADRFFLRKVNSTSRFESVARDAAWSTPSDELHRIFAAEATLPATASFLSEALRARVVDLYGRDVEVCETVRANAARPAASLQEA